MAFVWVLILLSALPSLLHALDCPRKTFFAVSHRESTTLGFDGGIALFSLQDGILKQEVLLSSSLAGKRASYIALNSRNFFSTNAEDLGELRSLRFKSQPPFIESITATSKGARSTHLSILGRIVAVANFGGSIATFISSKRSLKLADEFTVPPSLASRLRNASLSGIFAAPHPHMALPYRRGVVVPDLGADLVWYFGIDKRNGKLREISRTAMQIGDGPRHGVVHPKTSTIYIVNQISLTVVVLREGACGSDVINECYRKGLLDKPPEVENLNAAAIRVSRDGRFLYISVRWPDDIFGKIVAFRLDPATGDIVGKAGEWSSCGVHPRDFDIVDGVWYNDECSSFLAVANRDSDNIVMLGRDMISGALTADCLAISASLPTPISILNFQV